jgi:hypothetical protein
MVQSQPGQIVRETRSQKCLTQKRAVGVAQVIEYLCSKCEALSSNPSITKQRERFQIKSEFLTSLETAEEGGPNWGDQPSQFL